MEQNYSNNISGAAGYVSAGYASDAMQQACEARQSAKDRMRHHARQLRREADRLDALANALPEVLPPQADEALWLLLDKR